MITFLLAAYFSLYTSSLFTVLLIISAICKIDRNQQNIIDYPTTLKLFISGALISIVYAPIFVARALFIKDYIVATAFNIYLLALEEQ